MNQTNEFTRTRALATVAAQAQIAGTWVWEEKTVAQWNTDITAVNTQAEVAQDAQADADGARGSLNVAIDQVEQRSKQILALAKVKYRHDEAKLTRFANIRFESDGRPAILDDALSVESAWEKSDAAWVPLTGVTLAVFKTAREAAQALIKAEKDADGAWSSQEKILDGLCRELWDDNVAWYAAATRVFPAGTPFGDMIRATVPTSYTPPPLTPEAGVITLLSSEAPGEMVCAGNAVGATSINILRQVPGGDVFDLVATVAPDEPYSASGQPPGDYQFIVQGVNSHGTGPNSPPATLTVGE